MGLWYISGCILALCLAQVSTDDVKPVFIEDAREAERGLRIVSGWLAEPGQFPWQFNLRMVNAQGTVSSCGGSVIHREWGISAAHCTAMRVTLVVRAGVTSLTRPVYIFETNTWYNHPSYNDLLPSVVQPNDIAVVKFGRRLPFNELLRPIKLQSAADAFRNYEGLQQIASGFGTTWTGGSSTENLNWVYLRGVSNTDCFSTFGSIITANTICARYWNVTSQSTCQGDSGGPLLIVENEEPILVGVTSFVAGGTHGCHSGLPAGFIRTGPFHSWFEEVTGVNFEDLEFSSEEKEIESLESSSSESEESNEQTTSPSPPTTEREDTKEEDDDDTKEENDTGEKDGTDEESDADEEDATDEDSDTEEYLETEEGDYETSESDDDGQGRRKRCKCKVAVDVKVKVGK
ncbi:Serine protease 3 [Eumeta japonica]|uniref:Serine protease 3 n=1 Tax=Eumeta variegata TaxID=151549 RepID=A0A4C1YBJ1_EUMVA|nr:Serine protease 3 [Eumeta japonica]